MSYIMCPGAIVGPSSGPVPTASLFFRFITELALDYKKAVYIGEGTNVFYAVRIHASKALRLAHRAVLLQVRLDDLIDLYRRVFARILSREFANKSPYTRYYLGTSTPLVWKEIATCLGQTLHKKEKIKNAEPQSITVADLSKPIECVWLYPQSLASHFYTLDRELKVYVSATQNVQAERGKALGWEPRPVILNDWMEDGVKVALQVLEKEK